MIERILPPQVVAVERFADVAGELFAAEEAALGRAVERRRREFTSARVCAREALAGLGLQPQPLGAHRDGAPAWPAGVLGSITHCAGYRACAVARAGEVAGVGIDAEPHAPLAAGLPAAIALPDELREISEHRRRVPEIHWDRLLFSAKESVYKALRPLATGRLDFLDAQIALSPAAGTFHARLALGTCSGRWLVRDGLVLTAVVLQQDRRLASIPPVRTLAPRARQN